MALGSSLWQLQRRGYLETRSLKAGDIPGNPGYLHALFRGLDSLGWVDRSGRSGSPELEISWTESGWLATRDAGVLEAIPALLEQTLDLAEGLDVEIPRIDGQGPLHDWMRGHQIGPIMLGCHLRPGASLPDEQRRLLAETGWMDKEGWTEEGRIARLQSRIIISRLPIWLPLLAPYLTKF